MARLTKQQLLDNAAAEAATKEAQRVELARLRKEKRESKARASSPVPAPLVEEAKPFDPAAEDAARRAKIDSAWATLMEGFEVPSWKRSITGLVLGIAAAAGTGYLTGLVAGMLIVGAVALTGMAWLGWVIGALAMVLGAWLGGRVGSAVFGYIADKKIDDHFGSVKAKATSWFRKPEIVQFSGAHTA